jgi:phosphoadenosine phosphosulfate reductase
MTLKEQTLFSYEDKVEKAIKRLKEFEPEEGYYLAFSGGKDSVVIKALADRAGVKYDAHYNNTTIDPPELVRFIKDFHKDVETHNPEHGFFHMLVKKGFPLRQSRWCCKVFKENGGSGRRVITGIRWAESFKRTNRKMVESCYKDRTKRYFNVIIEWEDADIWEFIKQNNIPYCSLYDEGWKRLGCLMCPMSNKRKIEADRYPRYKNAFEKAFIRLHKKRKSEGKVSVDRWADGKEMFDWWLNENRSKVDPDQSVMFE